MSKNGRVLRNIFALLIGQVGTWSATFILTLVVPSYLGAQYYGLYSFVGTYAGFFGLGIALGTGTFLTWRIAREPSGASRLLINTLVMQLPLWLFWSSIAVLVLPLMDSSTLTRTLTIFSLITILLATLSSTCIAALSGFQIMRVPAFISVATALAGAAGAVVCVHLHVSIVAFVVVGAASSAANLVGLLIYTNRKIPLRARISLALWPKLVVGGLPFFAWSVVLLFYWQVDIIMLKVMVGDTVIGWYAVANRVISIPAFLPNIVVTAILPALSRERTADSPHFRALASRAIRLVTAVNIPASIGIIMLSGHVTSLLHFPGSFGQLAPLIVILSINMPIVALDMILGTILVSIGRQTAWTCVGVAAGLLNPLVNLWAIPYTQHMFGDGAIGASLTTIQSEVIMLAGALILRPKNIFTRWDMFYIFRCLVAAAIMVPAVQVFTNSSSNVALIASVGYGVLIYALACYALQVLSKEDLQGAVNVVAAKLGLGGLSRSQVGDMMGQLGLAAAQERLRGRLVRVRASMSRPLRTISQPLMRASTSVGATAVRYWNPNTWLQQEHDTAATREGNHDTGTYTYSRVQSGNFIGTDVDAAALDPLQATAPVQVPPLPLQPLSASDVASDAGLASNGNGNGSHHVRHAGEHMHHTDSQPHEAAEHTLGFPGGRDTGEHAQLRLPEPVLPDGV